MASKINSRLKSEKARSGKPYDRPKESSIFRKVADVFNRSFVPSWWSKPWGKPNEGEQPVPAATMVENEVHSEITEAASETVASRSCKRPRYESDNLEGTDISRPRTTAFLSPTTESDSPTERMGHNASQVAPSCDLEQRETQLIVNGDDHSENSEGTASTSGCSSLISSHVDKPEHPLSSIKLSENALENLHTGIRGKGFLRLKKDAGVSTENFFSSTCERSASQSDLSFWSRNSNLSFRNTLRPQPALQSPRPAFSVSSFGGPSLQANTSLSSREKVSSPFYEGRTTYGGASAYRRAQLSSLPYQSSRTLRNKITIKPSRTTDDSECMSSAAKRILQSLEKMSTPLTDVKKIPNVQKSAADISASLTPASQRRNCYFSLSRQIPLSTPYSRGPPVSSITSSSRLNLLKNFPKISKNSKMEIPVHDRTVSSLDQTTQSPAPDLGANKAGTGGGKIRTRINQHLHLSSKARDVNEIPEEVHLPNIPLPITDLPNINFEPKDKPVVTVSEEDHIFSALSESMAFTFASPIDRSPPETALQSQSSISDPAYTFCSPFNVKRSTTLAVSTKPSPEKEKVVNKPEEKETELYSGSVDDCLKKMRENNQNSLVKDNIDQENKNCFNSCKVDTKLLDPVDSGFGNKFKPEIGSWECSSCLVRNKPDVDKCVACETGKPAFSEKQQLNSFSFGNRFKPSPGSWECSACLVRNEVASKNCVACKAPRPGSLSSPTEQVTPTSISVGFGDKFKPSPDSWECTSCLVRNKACDSKCVCCGSENFGVAKDSKFVENQHGALITESDQGKSEKTLIGFPPAGSWKCDTCMEQNPAGQSKCVACETRTISMQTSDSKASSGFRFGLPAPASSTPFRFGSLVASPVSTTAAAAPPPAAGITFKINDTSETSKQQNSVKFGSTTLSVTGPSGLPTTSSVALPTASSTTLPATGSSVLPTSASEGFKFNSSSLVTSAESGSFKFGVPTSDVSLNSSEGLFKSEAPASKCDNPTPTLCFTFGDSNSNNQNKTGNHSETVATETSEAIEHKTEVETVAKSIVVVSTAATNELPKPYSVFPTSTSTSLTSISKAPCTTAVSSGITAGGFVFGGNTSNSQSQSAPTFQFGNKTDVIKASSGAKSSTQTTTVFTSTPASGSISSPSPFMFSGQTNKQFGSADSSTAADVLNNHHGMSQETPVELQSAPQVSSSSTLSIPPTSTSSQATNFIFGNSNAPPTTSSTSLFKLSSTITTTSTTDSTPKSSGIFTFGVSPSTETKDPKPGFSFASTVSEEKSQVTSQFSFNAFKPDSNNSVMTSASAATSSPFRFGTTSTPAPSTAGGFVFGAPKSEVSQTASSPFTFGSNVAAKPLNNSSFSGFTPNQPATTATVPSFTFGMTSSSAAPAGGGFSVHNSNPSSLFTFGAKTTQAAPNPINNAPALANPNPVFGSPASQSVFSNTSAIPSFGKPPEQKQETSGSFGFGSSAQTQGPVFRFGSTQDGPQEKRHAAAPPSAGGGFNFNLPQANSMSSSMNFNPTAPPSFNFGGASPSVPPLFQFNASTDSSTSGQSSGTRKIRKAVRRAVRKTD